MPRAKMGRPPKLDEPDKADLLEKFEKYIEETEIPILAEFTYKNGINRPWIYAQPDFLTLIKRCMEKKEAALESGTLRGTLNPAMAIFSLKQMGWKDRQERVVFVDPKTLSDAELSELVGGSEVGD